MDVRVVGCRLGPFHPAARRAHAEQVARASRDRPGLREQVWLADGPDGRHGGVHLSTDGTTTAAGRGTAIRGRPSTSCPSRAVPVGHGPAGHRSERRVPGRPPAPKVTTREETAMPFFDGSRGRVHHHAWLPDGDVHGVVVLLHGYGEHLGLYRALADRLVADGHAVHAMDAVGHGRSDGERAVIGSWDYYVDDARRLAHLATAQHPGRPLVLVGHSGGGLAAFLLALRSPDLARALVVSGAPLRPLQWVEDELNSAGEEDDAVHPSQVFSTHPEYVHALLHDPLTWHGGFRRETLAAIRRSWPEVAAGVEAGQPDVPVLFVHGEADPIVPLADALASARRLPRATLTTFPGDLHDVLNEHDRDTVHAAVSAFVTSAVELEFSRV